MATLLVGLTPPQPLQIHLAGRRNRRKGRPILAPKLPTLRRALSFAISLRRLIPPSKPLDLLLLRGAGGNGGSGGGFGSWFADSGGDFFGGAERKSGFVGLLASLALTAAISSWGKARSKRYLGIGVLIPAAAMAMNGWRRGFGVLVLLGFAFMGLISAEEYGRRRRRPAFWGR